MTVDWQQLAQALGTVTEHDSGRQEDGGTAAARLALASILGPAVWRDAVDHYVAGRPGAELSRSVLRMVRPAAAVERCLELLNDKTAAVEARRSAMELLRFIADGRSAHLVDELLQDEDPQVQVWAACMVDQLVWDDALPEGEARRLVDLCARHANEQVRERAAFVASVTEDRRARDT